MDSNLAIFCGITEGAVFRANKAKIHVAALLIEAVSVNGNSILNALFINSFSLFFNKKDLLAYLKLKLILFPII
jgi:hypothetical protein